MPIIPVPDEPKRPCVPDPCGSNAQCRESAGRAVCSCLPGFFGDPHRECRPECVISSECDSSLACIKQKCKDPCPGTCGISALCEVVNHNPICYCPSDLTGDPFVRCAKRKYYYLINFVIIIHHI